MRKISFCCFCILFVTIVSNAQSTVNLGNGPGGEKQKKSKSTETQIIKVSPAAALFGYLPFSYERRLSELISVQGSLGITFKNVLSSVSKNLEFNDKNIQTLYTWNGSPQTISFATRSSVDRKATPGYHIALQPRFYFGNEGMDGSFIGLGYEFSRFNYSADKVNTNVNFVSLSSFVKSGGTFRENENVSTLALTFGYQKLYNHLSIETGLGLGIRTKKGKYYAYGVDENNKITDGYYSSKSTLPALLVNFRLGYHF